MDDIKMVVVACSVLDQSRLDSVIDDTARSATTLRCDDTDDDTDRSSSNIELVVLYCFSHRKVERAI
jgi:hypothetical protein